MTDIESFLSLKSVACTALTVIGSSISATFVLVFVPSSSPIIALHTPVVLKLDNCIFMSHVLAPKLAGSTKFMLVVGEALTFLL